MFKEVLLISRWSCCSSSLVLPLYCEGVLSYYEAFFGLLAISIFSVALMNKGRDYFGSTVSTWISVTLL